MSDTHPSRQSAKLQGIIKRLDASLSELRALCTDSRGASTLALASLDSAAHELVAELKNVSRQVEPVSPAPAPANDDNADTSILLVEDNTVNRMVAEGMLQQIRCRIDVAENGEQAVEQFCDADYDIVFMDCQMPVKDGFEATAEIREIERLSRKGRTPIVALTANALKGDRERCVSAGMDDYVSKPFTIADLKGAIDRQLGGALTLRMRAPLVDDTDDAQLATHVGSRTPEPQAQDTIDRHVLDSSKGLQQSNGAELLTRIIDVFLKSAPDLLDKLLTSLEQGATREIASRAHALRSSCASVGAVMLADSCQVVEEQARREEEVTWHECAPVIEKRYRQAAAELRLIVSEHSA